MEKAKRLGKAKIRKRKIKESKNKKEQKYQEIRSAGLYSG